MSDSLFGLAGGTDAAGMFGTGSYGFGGSPDASTWSKLMSGLQSKEGQQALGGVGKSLLTASAAGAADDSRYLRTNALTPAWSPGTTNSLLNTLLQMRLQEAQQQDATLQNFRPSLLG
jgi:hypothetical protein